MVGVASDPMDGGSPVGSDPTVEGLSLLGEQMPLAEALQEMVASEIEPPVATRPDQPIPGIDRIEVPLTDSQIQVLARDLCGLVIEYKAAAREKNDIEGEIRDAYLQRFNSDQGGAVAGSAEMVSELVMSWVDQAAARLATNMLSVRPLIQVEPVEVPDMDPEFVEKLAKDTQTFLNAYFLNPEDMDFLHLLPVSILRTAKVGTSVFYINWEEERERHYVWETGSKNPRKVEKRVGKVKARLLDNEMVMIWPPDLPNWQRGYQIVGHRATLTPAEWRGMVAQYKIPAETVKLIEGTPPDHDNPAGREAERQGVTTTVLRDNPLLQPVDIWELWCHMMLPGEDEPDKFRLLLHEPTQTIAWIGYNGNHDQSHPYYPVRYKWSDNFAWGMGIGHEGLMNQAADTALWNLEIDNIMAGAYYMILRRAGAVHSTQSEDRRPGGEIVVEDVEKDFKPVKLGGEAPEITMSRGSNRQSGANAVGLSSVMMGQGDPTMKSGAGTGSTLALIEQGNKKMQYNDFNLRTDWSAIFAHILEQATQYGQEGIWYRQVNAEAAGRLKLLQYQPPRGRVSQMFRFRATAPSASTSDESRKQAYMLIWSFALQHAQVVSGYVERYLTTENPAALPRWYHDTAVSLTKIFTKIAEFNEMPGAERIAPDVPETTPEDMVINQLMQQTQTLQGELEQAQQLLQQYAGQGADLMGGGEGGEGAGTPTEQQPPPPPQMMGGAPQGQIQ